MITNWRDVPEWCCPYCGKPVGYLGRFWAWLVGVGIHDCDFSVYKRKHGMTDTEVKS